MGLGQEHIDFVPLAVECQRVCACFRRHHLLAAHCANIDDVYYPRIADGHVKISRLRIQEDYVGGAAKGNIAEHATRRCLNREQYASLKPGGVLFSSNPRGNNEEGWNGGRYGAYYDLDTWRSYVSAARFAELNHYYRPAGLPREKQPWLASVWRR
jgi:SAM-dependent methyltransferase